ncbi:hypothetical protein G9A89_000376 [Geosiphon pyriformis]|nr:hypothetical protein G9A89_000376 [Geosiphon pyriformis]
MGVCSVRVCDGVQLVFVFVYHTISELGINTYDWFWDPYGWDAWWMVVVIGDMGPYLLGIGVVCCLAALWTPPPLVKGPSRGSVVNILNLRVCDPSLHFTTPQILVLWTRVQTRYDNEELITQAHKRLLVLLLSLGPIGFILGWGLGALIVYNVSGYVSISNTVAFAWGMGMDGSTLWRVKLPVLQYTPGYTSLPCYKWELAPELQNEIQGVYMREMPQDSCTDLIRIASKILDYNRPAVPRALMAMILEVAVLTLDLYLLLYPVLGLPLGWVPYQCFTSGFVQCVYHGDRQQTTWYQVGEATGLVSLPQESKYLLYKQIQPFVRGPLYPPLCLARAKMEYLGVKQCTPVIGALIYWAGQAYP